MFKFLFGTQKTFDEELQDFNIKMIEIVNDLIKPYIMSDDKINNNSNKIDNKSRTKTIQNYHDLLNLLDPTKCNSHAIFLSNQLYKDYSEFDLKQYVDKVKISHQKFQPCSSDECSEVDSKTIVGKDVVYSKRDICDGIAVHYVKILNLISAILTAINPNRNMCLERIQSLFQQTETDINQGTIHICKNRDENNPLYPSNLLQVPGIKEFLNLYYFHLIHASTGDKEQQKIIREYQYLEN